MARRSAAPPQGCGRHRRWFQVSAEHVAFVLGKIVRLRAIAKVIDRNTTAEIDVLEGKTRLSMNRHQVVPHTLESFGKGRDVRRLRTDVNMYAANVEAFRMRQAAL